MGLSSNKKSANLNNNDQVLSILGATNKSWGTFVNICAVSTWGIAQLFCLLWVRCGGRDEKNRGRGRCGNTQQLKAPSETDTNTHIKIKLYTKNVLVMYIWGVFQNSHSFEYLTSVFRAKLTHSRFKLKICCQIKYCFLFVCFFKGRRRTFDNFIFVCWLKITQCSPRYYAIVRSCIKDLQFIWLWAKTWAKLIFLYQFNFRPAKTKLTKEVNWMIKEAAALKKVN